MRLDHLLFKEYNEDGFLVALLFFISKLDGQIRRAYSSAG